MPLIRAGFQPRSSSDGDGLAAGPSAIGKGHPVRFSEARNPERGAERTTDLGSGQTGFSFHEKFYV